MAIGDTMYQFILDYYHFMNFNFVTILFVNKIYMAQVSCIAYNKLASSQPLHYPNVHTYMYT